MYPRNNASPERIAIGQVVLIADGTIQSASVVITVRGQGGAEATGGGTTAYGAENTVYYTPTQAETNFSSFIVIASKASCFSVAQTIITTASATAGEVRLEGVTHTSAVIPSVTLTDTLTTYTGNTLQTADVASLNDVAATDIVSAGAITTLAGAVVNVDLVDTLTTYTGNTLQTGDVTTAINDLANATDGLGAIKATVDAIPTTAMRGTDSAALASVATEARLSELDAATAGKLANQVDIIQTDTTTDIPALIATGQSDLDKITGADGATLATAQGLYAPATAADVNAQMLDVLQTDTFAELAAVPGATSSLKDKLTWVFMLARNQLEQTATTTTVRADNTTTSVATSTVSDDGTTATRGELT